MADQTPKKPEEITNADIIQVAIACAKEHGWTVGSDDCRVQAILPTSQVVDEIGLGTSTFRFPVTKWKVWISPKTPPNKFKAPLAVTVEFWPSVGLDAEEFEGSDHPH